MHEECEFHYQRTRLSGLKSELMCELHYASKVVVGYFPGSSS
jgi:hypothetical protein